MPERAAQVNGEALRRIVLDQLTVPYVLRRSKRRTFGLSIDHRGLRVGAPPSATLREVEALLRQHGPWIRGKLDLWQQRQPTPATTIVDGVQLPLLGESFVVRLTSGANRRVWNAAHSELTLQLRSAVDAPRLLESALRTYAGEVLAPRLAQQAARMGLPTPPLALSSARGRWGSCNTQGVIRLNWRLLHLPLPLIDYVVIHELAHLREMNHGPRFWAIVAAACPDYQAVRRQLRQHSAGGPLWQGEKS